ncbi:MAG: very short patch repair endonuclease [Proteobacteria bacterium]|nr:MAG: very short patch repair endonuclease [Pseudomonadota bacterium]
MIDIVSSEKRSRMMAGIKGKNTRPELAIRSRLHRLGFRFRIHDNRLPGKPDIVLKKYHAVIFVHGCFWHRHGCHLFKWPKTRPEFWEKKINSNAENDQKVLHSLSVRGWRVCIVWECAIKGSRKKPIEDVADTISEWLAGGEYLLEISG